jgi:hypothetical protein
MRADRLIIVAPEYNHGYPGMVKHAPDSKSEGVHSHAGWPVRRFGGRVRRHARGREPVTRDARAGPLSREQQLADIIHSQRQVSGRLHEPDTATVVRVANGEILTAGRRLHRQRRRPRSGRLGAHCLEERLRLPGLRVALEAADDLTPDPVDVGVLLVAIVVGEAGVAEQQTCLAGIGGGS